MNVVAHNLSAMNAQRQFGINTAKRAKSTEKLSSGYKINRAADSAGNKSVLGMKDLTISNFTTNGSDEWSRDFTYSAGNGTELTITQTVKLDESVSDEKKYVISYDFAKSADIENVEFMFHVDTAYNNNDTCEGYFIDGNRVEKFCVYNQDAGGSDLTNGSTSAYVYNGNVPDSFSIVDVDRRPAKPVGAYYCE